MIIYFDGPNVNFINSIIEYDLIKKIPPEYTLNLLTSDKNKKDYNNIENSNQNDTSKNMNVYSIQRELINLLSYDYDPISNVLDKEEKEEKKEESKENLQNYSTEKMFNLNLPLINDDLRYMNNQIFNNRVNNNNNLYNINNPMNINMNIPAKINPQFNNNLNDLIILI